MRHQNLPLDVWSGFGPSPLIMIRQNVQKLFPAWKDRLSRFDLSHLSSDVYV